MMIEGNGNNRFWIEVKCLHQVYDEEWAEILFLLNDIFKNYDNGKFSNVGAYLMEKESGENDETL